MTKQLFIASTLIMLMITSVTKAQDTKAECQTNYEKETIFLNGNFAKYVKNGESKKVGILGGKIKKEFEQASNEAKGELEQFQKKNKRGTILLTTGMVCLVTAIAVVPYVGLPVFAGLTGAGFVSYGFGIADATKAPKHLSKAIWLRNRDVLAQK